VTELKVAMSRAPMVINARFRPWVGQAYGMSSAFGSDRILILGESHYEWCERCRRDRAKRSADLTAYCIAERIVLVGLPGQLAHWTKIENAFLGVAAQAEARREFWHAVSYYNFLQEVMDGPRVSVPRAIWAEAEPAFFEVLEALKPTCVVALGRRLWAALPVGDNLPPLEVNGKILRRRRYLIRAALSVVICGIDHPSAGLGATWRPVLQQAIARGSHVSPLR
jgi:hypothetical protein